jgi:hypothetical protein
MQPPFAEERHGFEWLVATLARCGEACFLEISKFVKHVQREGKKSANPQTSPEASSPDSSEPSTDIQS